MTTLKLGDRVRAPGRLFRRKQCPGRNEWRKPGWKSRPVEGIFVGVRTYVNGTTSVPQNYDDPVVFEGDEWIKIALICEDARHKPVPCLYSECEVI